MAYREPQSTIYLFKGCPCDHEYNNTIYFESKAQQWDYFRRLPRRTYSNQNYQRVGANTLKIRTEVNPLTDNAGTEDIYEYNYLMFSNDSRFSPLGNPSNDVKIFYAFITGIEYVNDNSTEITYEIDVMQTYMFDYKLGYCFVEREHSLTDKIGDSRTPEPFDGKDYYYTKLYQLSTYDYLTTKRNAHYYLAIKYVPNDIFIDYWVFDNSVPNAPTDRYLSYHQAVITDGQGNNLDCKGEIRNQGYSGCKTLYIPLYSQHTTTPLLSPIDYHNIENAIKNLVDISAQIVEISLLPNFLVNLSKDTNLPTERYDDFSDYSLYETIQINRTATDFESMQEAPYTCINKKLLQSPYDVLYCTSNQGDEKELRWEDFSKKSTNNIPYIQFSLEGVVFGNPEIDLIPIFYNTGNEGDSYINRIAMYNFPSISWNEDSFARMWSENKNKITNGLIQSAISSLAETFASVAGGVIGGAIGSKLGGAVGSFAGNKALGKRVGKTIKTASQTNIGYQLTGERLGSDIVESGESLVNQAAALADAKNVRDIINGTQSGTQMPVLNGKIGFTLYRKSIKPYYAKQIDNFFSAYGYSVRQLKIPNIFSNPNKLRPRWNFIKNVNTVILPLNENQRTRYINEETESKIKQIFNKGITYWMHGEEVGDYSLDNSPQE